MRTKQDALLEDKVTLGLLAAITPSLALKGATAGMTIGALASGFNPSSDPARNLARNLGRGAGIGFGGAVGAAGGAGLGIALKSALRDSEAVKKLPAWVQTALKFTPAVTSLSGAVGGSLLANKFLDNNLEEDKEDAKWKEKQTPLSEKSAAFAQIKEAANKTLAITTILTISANLKAIHVNTRKYAQHMALDDAFEDLNNTIDKFNECVQGYYRRKIGRRLSLKNAEITFKLPPDDEVFDAVKELEDKFLEASNGLVEGISPLISLQDDVLNNFYQLYYRLDLK